MCSPTSAATLGQNSVVSLRVRSLIDMRFVDEADTLERNATVCCSEGEGVLPVDTPWRVDGKYCFKLCQLSQCMPEETVYTYT
jgi:hypothetical protein